MNFPGAEERLSTATAAEESLSTSAVVAVCLFGGWIVIKWSKLGSRESQARWPNRPLARYSELFRYWKRQATNSRV